MTATVTGIADKPEQDGSQVLEIVTPEGQRLEAVIPAADLPLFLRTMQGSLIQRSAVGEGNVALPELEVTDINLGHRGRSSHLLVSTQQIGSFMLLLSDALLLRLKNKVAGAVLHRSGPSSKN